MPTLIKTLNTRIRLRYDTLANWELRNPVLLSGEMAIAAVVPEGNQTITAAVAPQILVKVGDGTSHYHDLQYISGYSADVYEWAKQAHPGDSISINVTNSSTALNPGDRVVSSVAWDANKDNITVTTKPLPGADFVQDVSEGSTNGTIDVLKNEIITPVSVHGLKSAAYTESSAYATAAQGTKADAAARTFNPEQGSEWLVIHNPENGAVTYEAVVDTSTPFVHLSIGTAPEMLKVDYDANYIDGTLSNQATGKLLTKGKADGYYATAAQGAKADAAVRAATTSGSGLDVSIGEDALHTLTIYGSWISNIGQSPDSPVPATSAAVKTYVDNAIAELGTAVTFVGVSTSDPASATGATYAGHTTWKKGEVVLYGNKEYINVTGSNASSTTPNPNWKELGDEGSYALKTVTITGTGYLTGGGTLEANRTIDINQTTKNKINSALQSVAGPGSGVLGGNITFNKSGTTSTMSIRVAGGAAAATNGGLQLVGNDDGIYVGVAGSSLVDGTASTTNKLLTQTSIADMAKLSGNNTWTGTNAFNGSSFSVDATTLGVEVDGKNIMSANSNTNTLVIGEDSNGGTHINGNDITLVSERIGIGKANADVTLEGTTVVSGSISWSTAPSIGSHLTNKTYVDGKVSSAIDALDKSDAAVAKNVVTAVSEANGIITVTRKELKATTGLTITNTSGSPTVNIDDTCVFVFNCGDSVNITE